MKWLQQLFSPTSAKPPHNKADTSRPVLPTTVAAPVIHAYPSVDSGYPAIDANQVLVDLQERIQQIRVAVTPEVYSRHYEPAVLALATWILSLPKTESDEFMTPEGLMRCALETAFHCQRMAEQSLFAASEQVEKRRTIEQRWCIAAFMSGLFADISALTTMTVVASSGNAWACFTQSLTQFIAEQQTDRFYLSFRPVDPQQSLSSTLAQRILPADVIQYMHDGHPTIVPTFLAAIDGKTNHSAPRLFEILNKARAGVLHQETLRQPQQYGRVRQGTHLEPYLLDGLRNLATSWKINTAHGDAWHTEDGLFLRSDVLRKVAEHLRNKKVSGIPTSVETLAELLHAANVLIPTDEGRLFWTVYPAGHSPCAAIKLASAEIIYGWDTPAEKIASIAKPPKSTKKKPVADQAASKDLFQETTPTQSDNVEQPTPAEDVRVEEEASEKADAAAETAEVTSEIKPEEPATEQVPEVIDIISAIAPERQSCAQNPPEEETDRKVLPASPPGRATPKPQITQPKIKVTTPPKSAVHAPDLTSAADATPVNLQLGEQAETLLKHTHDPAISEFLRAVITDYNAGKKTGMQWCEVGFAISREVIPRFGMDEMVLFNKLHGCGWLAKNPKKPSQKFLEIEFPDGKARALVLKTFIAQDLGITS